MMPSIGRKKLVKYASVLLARLSLVLMMVGAIFAGAGRVECGQVYHRVIKAGVLRLGVPYNWPPWGFPKSSGEVVGFEVDLAEEIARHLNLKLVKVKVTDQSWRGVLAAGQIDAALCRIRVRRSLARSVDFSIPYFFDCSQVLTVKGAFKTPSDLKGHKIVVAQGSTYDKVGIALLKGAGDETAEHNVVIYPDGPSCFMAVGQEKVAGWLNSGMTLLEYSSQSPDRFGRISIPGVVDEIAAATPKNDSAFRNMIGQAIQDMAADGSFMKVYDRWFGPSTRHAFPIVGHINVWPD